MSLQMSSDDRVDLTEAVNRIRVLLIGDGADIELDGWDEVSQVLSLRLILDNVECLDCVLPREHLESVALDVIRRSGGNIVAVRFNDPRET